METETISLKIDAKKQTQAKAYALIRRRLMLADLLFSGIYALAWLVFGWSGGLKQSLLGITDSPWLLVLLYTAVFGGIYFLLNLPLSYYSEYVLPHRFGQSNQGVRGWVLDQVKGILVGAVIGGILLEVIYAVLRAFPDTWWLWASGVMLVFSVLLADLAPVLLFPIFYKFTPLGAEHQDLADRLMRLSEQAGTHVKGVYQFDMSSRTNAANAALTGMGNTRRIILGDTLIKEFSPEEIETVLAHELGHHVNNDLLLSIGVETISTLVGLWLASLALRWGVGAFGFAGTADIAALPVFALAMGLFGLVTMPLTNGFTRWRESLADRYALEATHKSAAFASAMTRLANQNLGELDPEPWVEFLLYSHPALSKRIKMAEEWKG